MNLWESYLADTLKTTSGSSSPPPNTEADDFEKRTLKRVCESFGHVLFKIETLYSRMKKPPPDYLKDLKLFVAKLKSVYDIPAEAYYIDPANVDVVYWGNAVWAFLHLASILVQHGLKTHVLKYVHEFPKIMRHIDDLMPCDKCIDHYVKIKDTQEVHNAVKDTSHGFCVLGVYQFHSLVTRNIMHSTGAYGYKPFTRLDFMLTYGLYPDNNDTVAIVEYNTRGVLTISPVRVVTFSLLSLKYWFRPLKVIKKLKTVPEEWLKRVNAVLLDQIDVATLKHEKQLYFDLKKLHDDDYRYETIYDVQHISRVPKTQPPETEPEIEIVPADTVDTKQKTQNKENAPENKAPESKVPESKTDKTKTPGSRTDKTKTLPLWVKAAEVEANKTTNSSVKSNEGMGRKSKNSTLKPSETKKQKTDA